MFLRRKGDKKAYSFHDIGCLGRKCFAPGMYQHRGATLSGSRNTGSPDTPCCMNRAYHGCPSGPVGENKETHLAGLPEIDNALVKIRKAEGWK